MNELDKIKEEAREELAGLVIERNSIMLGDSSKTWEVADYVAIKLFDKYIDKAAQATREKDIEVVEKQNHLIHESQLCQNQNMLDYCCTCEQPWDDCSCPARNTGAKNMKRRIIQAIRNL